MHDEQNCSQNFRENVKIQKLVFDEYFVFVKLMEYHSALVAWKSDEHFFLPPFREQLCRRPGQAVRLPAAREQDHEDCRLRLPG